MIKLTGKPLGLTQRELLELEGNYLAVPNNQGTEICRALVAISDLLEKYDKFVLVSSTKESLPPGILQGFVQYCRRNQKSYGIIEHAAAEIPSPGTAYFTVNDADLAALIEVGNVLGYKIGQALGILSLDDSPLKKLLGLTALTTDIAATVLHEPLFFPHPQLGTHIRNATVIRRESL